MVASVCQFVPVCFALQGGPISPPIEIPNPVARDPINTFACGDLKSPHLLGSQKPNPNLNAWWRGGASIQSQTQFSKAKMPPNCPHLLGCQLLGAQLYNPKPNYLGGPRPPNPIEIPIPNAWDPIMHLLGGGGGGRTQPQIPIPIFKARKRPQKLGSQLFSSQLPKPNPFAWVAHLVLCLKGFLTRRVTSFFKALLCGYTVPLFSIQRCTGQICEIHRKSRLTGKSRLIRSGQVRKRMR